MNERLKNLPEIRGFGYTPAPRVDTNGNMMQGDPMYSVNSYAAMYGIEVEEAEFVVQSCRTHTQADKMITSTLYATGKLKEVIGRTDKVTMDDLTEEEKRFLQRGTKAEVKEL